MRVSESSRCAAPVPVVWECLRDDERRLRSHAAAVSERRLLDDGDTAVALVIAGHREEMRLRVVESLPPDAGGAARLVERRVDGGREGQTIFELRPDGDGTRITITAEADLPMLLAALAGGPLRAALREQLENLCRASDGAAPR